jgi:3',5'-cyclic AMP phosphodiesterase CpdA
VLCVPGNHDIPLENLPARLVDPWRGWRRWIREDLEFVWRDPELRIVGVNTVNRFDWQRGRIGRRALHRICDVFDDGDRDGAARVLVAHHPFEHDPEVEKSLMRGADRGLRRLADCGTDVVLTGHLHAWRAGPFTAGGALQVHAGTTLSTRRRSGQENDFNILTFDRDEIAVDRHAADETGRFGRVSRSVFRRGPEGWRPAD